MKKFINKHSKFLLIIPVIIMTIILVVSMWIFDQDMNQTYNRVKNLKETQVKVLTAQVDHVMQITGEEITKNEIDMISTTVSELNRMQGVYCYLYDKDCKRLSEYSGLERDIEIARDLRNQLETGNYKIIESHGSYGYVSVKSNITNEEFEMYWQGIPSHADAKDCEYFIILAVSKSVVEGNEAVIACKGMIAILTILLTLSLYDSIYFRIDNNHKKDEDK